MAIYEAVVTTGIYCRPGCPGQPKPDNVRWFPTAAAAEAAGYRACLRCRPYRLEPPAPWDDSEVVCRAVRLIVDGFLDRGDEPRLAARVGVSDRHLRRLFAAQLGVTPDGLAKSRRAHFARRLLDDTDLTITDIAFASGFGSVRQLNRVMTEVFRAPPSELRRRRRNADRLVADGGLSLRLPTTGPVDWAATARYLAARAIPGVESVEGDIYRRTVVIEGDPGVLELGPGGPDHLRLRAHLPHWDGLIHVAAGARRLAGVDVDLTEALAALEPDPVLGPLFARRPGLRVPGTWDPWETGVRAIVGQHVSVAAASTFAGRIVAACGTPVAGLAAWGLTHTFPTAERLAEADLAAVGLTTKRAAAVRTFAAAVRDDAIRLDGSVGLDTLVASVAALPGLGEWTGQYLALRMGERDAFPAGDLGLRKAWAALTSNSSDTALAAAAERWRPWRALAAVHLWATAAEPLPLPADRAVERPPAGATRAIAAESLPLPG
ncbi:MAG TPA: AlkA N-terminal domain-containing protein [Acidimicrobiales bacterium]|nr:AlkA N-terminal domain-containing protein [Acidimicrobiales bacterium]